MNSIPDSQGKGQTGGPFYPPDLIRNRQFVVWKREPRSDGSTGKVPYNARAALSGKFYRASVTKERSWSTFTQANQAYQRGQGEGIGYVLTTGVIFLDIDHCIQAGEIDPRAREIIATLQSWTEPSPSQDGLHILMRGQLPPGAHSRYEYHGLKFEIYDTGRYATLTGLPLNGLPFELQERTGEVAALLQQCQHTQENVLHSVCGGGVREQQAQRRNQTQAETRASVQIDAGAEKLTEADLNLAERIALKKARAAKNGAEFEAYWQNKDPKKRLKADGSADQSAGDWDLVLMLLYWTYDNPTQTARLFRASERYREDKGNGKSGSQSQSYLERTITKALERRHRARKSHKPAPGENVGSDPEPEPPRQPARQDRRITHAHHWTRRSETAAQREELLREKGRAIFEQISEHIRADQRDLVQIQAVAPGIGKTHAAAEVGRPGSGLKIAWIAERRDMRDQVEALKSYRLIEPCTRHNCSDHERHQALASKSYNTMPVHKRHFLPCDYVRQFDGTESAIYQLAHVRSKHPTKDSAGIIIDELDLTKWLPERAITIKLLISTLKLFATGSTADLLIRALEATITDAEQARQSLHSKAFFDALDQRAGGHLYNWVAELRQDTRNMDTHPWTKLEETEDMAQEWEIQQLAPIVLPHVLCALDREILKWQRGEEWNGYIRIGKGEAGWALYLTEPLRFVAGENGIPARVVLDATAPDEEILSRVLGEQVKIQRATIDPPPGTRHIAMRTNKRYGLVALCATPHDKKNGLPLPNKYLLRAVAEIRYLLRELDPDGTIQAAQKVGLITFKRCEDEIGDELKIPEHRRMHFWATRGSNKLADCDILIVLGTPTTNPEAVARMARAIWADDPRPINPAVRKDDAGRVIGYEDERLEKLNRYLTRAELTQCAHRSRALREARTVITMCQEEIDYLPATETIIDMPQLNPEGLDAWKARRRAERKRLDQARQELEQTGKTVHMIRVRELRALANCSTDTAAEYLRRERRKAQSQQAQEEREARHTHPPLVQDNTPEFVPEMVYEISHASPGTNPQAIAPLARPLDREGSIMAYGRAAGHPEIVLPGIQIPAGSSNWARWMYMSRTPEDQRQAVYDYVQSMSGPPALAG